MTVIYEPEQKVGPYTLIQSFGSRVGSEAWWARDSEDREVLVRIVTDPEIQIILREQSEYLEDLEKQDFPPSIMALQGCNPFAEPPFTSEPFQGGLRTLRTILRDTSPLPYPLAIAYFGRLIAAYGELLSVGLFHGALLPENILVDENGGVTICGMGWGRIATTMLRRGVLGDDGSRSDVGAYFAPEQVTTPSGFAPPADFYTLGAVLYELVTGATPVAGFNEDDASFDVHLREVPEELRQLLRRLLDADPNQRLCVLDEVRESLPEVSEEIGIASDAAIVVDTRPAGLNDPHAALPPLIHVLATSVQLPLPSSLKDCVDELRDAQSETGQVWISKVLISAQQYCIFLRHQSDERIGQWIEFGDFGVIDYVDGKFLPHRGIGNCPAIGVSRLGAEAFCSWLSEELGHPFRLPTAAEWLAAAGTPVDDGPAWPWGDGDPTPELACFGRRWRTARHQVLEPVEALDRGASPLGMLQAAGSVAEWTSTTLADLVARDLSESGVRLGGTGLNVPKPETIGAIVGGSWRDEGGDIAPRRIALIPASFKRITIGFRIASSEQPEVTAV